jgi:acyl carrier protein
MNIRETVFDVVLAVARQHDPSATAVRLEQSLSADLGFESLDLAQVAAELEVRLGLDPFAQYAASQVRTVSDLVTLYEAVAKPRT